jgi:hypothetical protein
MKGMASTISLSTASDVTAATGGTSAYAVATNLAARAAGRRLVADSAVGEGVLQLGQRAVTEQELKEGVVGEADVAVVCVNMLGLGRC